MLFYSFEFMYLFLPVAVAGYFVFGKRQKRTAVIWLVCCSLFFYGWWDPFFVFLLVGSMLFNYFYGLLLRKRKGKIYLILGVMANLCFIGYYKYAAFLFGIVSGLSGMPFGVGQIILPLGISFFTFQQIAWLVDCHSNRISQQDRGIWEYGLFVSFFPQLIAGPIVHHSEMMPQFHEEKNRFFSWESVAIGITIFVIGLSKKAIIADSAAPYANMVFDAAKVTSQIGMVDAWIGALSYTVQLYFDFSGYADMAIGLGLMFNIRLPINFESPYKAVSLSDFWRRWHITLGRFLRDYVYIPLGGSRSSELRHCTNLLFTMLVCGLWHGAGWTFVLWGGIHGIYLVVEQIWKQFAGIHIPPFITRWVTFVCIVFAWVLFRAETFDSALMIMRDMLGFSGISLSASPLSPEPFRGLTVLIPALIIAFFLPNTQELIGKNRSGMRVYRAALESNFPRFAIWQPDFKWAAYATVLSIISVYFLLDQSKLQEFIYFQF